LRFPSPNVKEGDFEGYYGTSGEGEGKSIFFWTLSLDQRTGLNLQILCQYSNSKFS